MLMHTQAYAYYLRIYIFQLGRSRPSARLYQAFDRVDYIHVIHTRPSSKQSILCLSKSNNEGFQIHFSWQTMIVPLPLTVFYFACFCFCTDNSIIYLSRRGGRLYFQEQRRFFLSLAPILLHCQNLSIGQL